MGVVKAGGLVHLVKGVAAGGELGSWCCEALAGVMEGAPVVTQVVRLGGVRALAEASAYVGGSAVCAMRCMRILTSVQEGRLATCLLPEALFVAAYVAGLEETAEDCLVCLGRLPLREISPKV